MTIRTAGSSPGEGLIVKTSADVVSDRLVIHAHSDSAAVTGLHVDTPTHGLSATDTRIDVSQSLSSSSGEAIGIYVEAGDSGHVFFSGLRIDVDNQGPGKGVYLVDASISAPIVTRIRNAVIEALGTDGATYGVFTTAGADVRIVGSTIRADDDALYAATADSTQTVVHTLLEGGVQATPSAFTCRSVYDDVTLSGLDNQCQIGL